MFQPQYILTHGIVRDLTTIAEAKAVIDRARLLPAQEVRLRRQALIRMTHSSTAIEGNVLDQKQVEAIASRKKIDAPDRDVYEVRNYLAALKYIESVVLKKIPFTERVFLRVHRLVTQDTLPTAQSGRYRTGLVYVVRRRAGLPPETRYTAPAAPQVPALVRQLVRWIQASANGAVSPVIVAGLAHLEIAGIHPFADGNGRTARAIATLILYSRGYDFRRLFALEDYYNKDRSAYYAAIHLGKTYAERQTDVTPWLSYFVRGFRAEIESVKRTVAALSGKSAVRSLQSRVYLKPEQLKLLDFLEGVEKITVRDAMEVLRVPRRTAQLELQKMKKLTLIRQVGKGPAAGYVAG